jgi:hypothetical protein
MSSEENPIVTWAVQLTGSAGTLRRWEGLFTDPELAIVEGEGAEGFSLRSTRFDGLPGNEIQGVAADLVGKMNSVIAQFGGAEPVSVGQCLAIFADGTRERHVFMDFTMPIEIALTSGTITFDEAEKAEVIRWLRLAERQDYIADALRFLHRGTWFDLYFACEVLGYDCGDQHKLMQRQWAKDTNWNSSDRMPTSTAMRAQHPAPHSSYRCQKRAFFWKELSERGSPKSLNRSPEKNR